MLGFDIAHVLFVVIQNYNILYSNPSKGGSVSQMLPKTDPVHTID